MAIIAATGTTFTPIGNPGNLLVMGPGSYRMADYVKVGLPLALVLGAVGLIVIPLVLAVVVSNFGDSSPTEP